MSGGSGLRAAQRRAGGLRRQKYVRGTQPVGDADVSGQQVMNVGIAVKYGWLRPPSKSFRFAGRHRRARRYI